MQALALGRGVQLALALIKTWQGLVLDRGS